MLSFAGTSRGVSVDLSTESWSFLARVMPLGDSITSGSQSPGNDGYRGPLWRQFAQTNMAVDFVGSFRDGPSSLPDRDHQGTPGQRADELAPLIPKLMTRYAPDIVLLMIGSNDIEQEGQ